MRGGTEAAIQRLDAARAAVEQAKRLPNGVPILTFDPEGPLGRFLDLATLLRPGPDGRDFTVQYLNPEEAARSGCAEGCPCRDATPSGLHERLLESARRMLREPGLHSVVGVVRDARSPETLWEAAGFSCPVSVNGRTLTHVARFFRFAPAPRGSVERLFHDVWTSLDARAMAS